MASNYEQLVKALRRCQFGHGMCAECPYYGHKGKWNGEDFSDCDDKMHLDAAAAIEALQAKVERLTRENKELVEDHPEMEEVNGHWEWKKPNGDQQLPNRGEWVEENRRPRSSQFVCSECHRTAYDPQPTRDKAWRKRCRYAYCPNCGADMRAKMEVQDG